MANSELKMTGGITIIDINGFEWIFDGWRVYLSDAEDEMEAGQNGYPCDTLTQAKTLVSDNSGGLFEVSAVDDDDESGEIWYDDVEDESADFE